MIATVDRSLENTISAETGAPAWWHGDEDAYQSGIAAARALGVG